MRVKIFVDTFELGVEEPPMEDKINEWLSENTNIEIKDIKLSADFIRSNIGPDFHAVTALVLYEERQAFGSQQA